ncbi:Crp/Fnr family transcriptional regulator [Bradyrhizobium sp. CIR3A]|uniref:Crp/Fnr family transcriptional regulator n=1 Tax=Bradyrhizobium sp. CIR3A TaxID=2663838 RepID=UPI001605DF82|nr:Crp/Fnr family transcriptional regulator [Bradyrhizobium sp. CIR3A]MBB4264112.1 hypothetical protein [Bradyrhizobium sp. CIR3A]
MAEHEPSACEAPMGSGDAAQKPLSAVQATLDPARSSTRPFVKNAILAGMSVQDLAVIGKLVEPVVLRERMVLQEPKSYLDHVYFIESGLISVRIVAAGSILETAVIGRRGAVGASLAVGGSLPIHQSVVLFPGSAHRIRVEDLRRITNERFELREHLSRYAQGLSLHCAQTGFCGIRHDREKRLACWLCLASDALEAWQASVGCHEPLNIGAVWWHG